MIRPGPPKSTHVSDFHAALGHANLEVLSDTGKEVGVKLTGLQEHCDGCTEM